MPLIYIEHEGALFKGPTRAHPTERYDFRDRNWHPYKGETPKAVDWGTQITEAEATVMMADHVEG